MTKKADTFLQAKSQELQQLFAKVTHLQALNERLGSYIDTTLAPYCQVANIIAHKLTIIVANGSIATQIRYQSIELIKKFKKDPLLKEITHIECKVRPVLGQPTMRKNISKTRKMEHLSSETANLVKNIAESIQDAKLREALIRIANKEPLPKA